MVVRNSSLKEYSNQEIAFNDVHLAPARDPLQVLIKQKNIILAAFFMTIFVVYVGFKLHTPTYQARVKLLIRAEKLVESPYYRDLDNSIRTEMVSTQAEIVKSKPVLERVVKAMRLDERPLNYEKKFASPLKQLVMSLQSRLIRKSSQVSKFNNAYRFRLALRDLNLRVKVKPIPNTSLFSISAEDFDPAVAAQIANTVSHYYVMFDLEQQMAELGTKYGEKNNIIRQLRSDAQRFETYLSSPSGSYADSMGPASAKILEEATVPTEAVGYSTLLVMCIAGICGLILGVALAFLFERPDPILQSTDARQPKLPMEDAIRALKEHLEILLDQETRKQPAQVHKLSSNGGDPRFLVFFVRP